MASFSQSFLAWAGQVCHDCDLENYDHETCHPDLETCHPDLETCHPDLVTCHPENAIGFLYLLSYARLEFLPLYHNWHAFHLV